MTTITAGRSHFVLIGIVWDEDRFIIIIIGRALRFLGSAETNVYWSHFTLQIFVLSGEGRDHFGLALELGLCRSLFVSSELAAKFLFLLAL